MYNTISLTQSAKFRVVFLNNLNVIILRVIRNFLFHVNITNRKFFTEYNYDSVSRGDPYLYDLFVKKIMKFFFFFWFPVIVLINKAYLVLKMHIQSTSFRRSQM